MTRETELRAWLAELHRQHAAGMNRITDLLVAGADTGPTRLDIAALQRRILVTEEQLADAAAQREAEALKAISVATALIAADAQNAIVAKLAALQPPEHP